MTTSRYTIVLLVAVLIIVITFSSYQASVEQPAEIPEFDPQTYQLNNNLQNLTDKVAQAAIDEDWLLCEHCIGRLQTVWDDDFKPQSDNRLELTLQIDRAVSELSLLVLARNKNEIIASTSHLTQLFSTIFT